MKLFSKRWIILPILTFGMCAGSVLAQSQGGPPEIIPHRMNSPHQSGAPTAGSTALQTPTITYNGGPVMATPTVYLIWYGNWNQSNGSDTPARRL